MEWMEFQDELYEVYCKTDLPYSSLTFHWLDDYDEATMQQSFITGTQENQHDEVLRLGKVQYSLEGKSNRSSGGTVHITKMFDHPGTVHVARPAPRFNNIVACADQAVAVYDINEDSYAPPLIRISFHGDDCWALGWSPHYWANLATGGNDCKIGVWDLYNSPKQCGQPIWNFKANDLINDIQWHPTSVGVFGAALDSGHVLVNDIRSKDAAQTHALRLNGINTLSFSPYNATLLVVGDVDSGVTLFDTRFLDKPLHALKSHTGAVNRVQWNPHYDGVLASCSDDETAVLWDIKKIGGEFEVPQDWDDGPPELLYRHAAYKSKVVDLNWNPHLYWNLGTVEEANDLTIWTPSENVINDTPDQIDRQHQFDIEHIADSGGHDSNGDDGESWKSAEEPEG